MPFREKQVVVAVKPHKVKHYYTDEQLQFLIFTAKRLSYHYHRKFPNIDFDEFFSIAQVAIAEALKSYKKNKGTLHSWVSHYIYARFHNYITRNYKRKVIITTHLSKAGYFLYRRKEVYKT